MGEGEGVGKHFILKKYKSTFFTAKEVPFPTIFSNSRGGVKPVMKIFLTFFPLRDDTRIIVNATYRLYRLEDWIGGLQRLKFIGFKIPVQFSFLTLDDRLSEQGIIIGKLNFSAPSPHKVEY